MFVGAVFNGARCRVFDPAVRPGMPRLGLVVSNASSPAGVAAAVAGEVRTAPQRVLLRPGQTESDAIAGVVGRAGFGDSGLPRWDAFSPGGGVPAGWVDAAFALAHWRAQVTGLAADPSRLGELVSVLRERPDALSGAAGGCAPPVVAGRAAEAERFGVGLSTMRETGADYATGVGPVSREWSHAAAVVDGVVARRVVMAQLAADEAADLELLSREYPGVDQFLATEVGRALGMSDGKAGGLVDRAQRLVRRLPGTWAALAAGRISVDVADAVLAATDGTSVEIAGRVESAVVPGAAGRTYQQVFRSCAYRVVRWDAQAARDRHRTAVAERGMTRRVLADGMAQVTATGTAQDIAAVWQTLTGLAHAAKTPGDGRSLGNRRVDVLVDVCADALDRYAGMEPVAPSASAGSGDGDCRGGAVGSGGAGVGEAGPQARAATDGAPGGGGPGDGGAGGGLGDGGGRAAGGSGSGRSRSARRRRAQVRVTMPLSALLGGDAPAWLQGHGWITAEQARRIAADAELTRMLCDPVSGQVLDVGTTRYRPPQRLQQLVKARDVLCVMPGCHQIAEDCDVDHVITARRDRRTGKPTLGRTDKTNLGPLCRHHHLAKDGYGWTLTRDPDGTYTWTSPLGRTYTREPIDQLGEPEYLPDPGGGADGSRAAGPPDHSPGSCDDPPEPDAEMVVDRAAEADEESWEERTWREAVQSHLDRLDREQRELAERERRRLDGEPPPF